MSTNSLVRRLGEAYPTPLIFYFLAAAVGTGAFTAFVGPVRAGAAYVVAGMLILFTARIDLCVLFLLLVRSSLDFSTEYSLVSMAHAANLNVAAALNLILVASGTVFLLVKRIAFWRLPGARFLGAFLVVSMLTIGGAPSIPTAFADWLRNLSCFVIYSIVATVVVGSRKVTLLLDVVLFSALVPLLVGFYQKSMGVGFYNRVYATFFHPNTYGVYLILIAILAYALLHLRKSLVVRVCLISLILCCGLSLLWTLSRGAWIAALVSIGLIAALTRWKSSFAGLGIIVLLARWLPQISQRFEDVTSPMMHGSLQWRVGLWKKMVVMIQSHLILGYGLGSFYFYSEGWSAHNDYLRLAFETGIAGLALYLLGVFSIGFFALRQMRKGADPFTKVICVAFVGILTGFLVASAAQNVVMAPVLQWYLWALAGVVVSLGTRGEGVAAEQSQQ